MNLFPRSRTNLVRRGIYANSQRIGPTRFRKIVPKPVFRKLTGFGTVRETVGGGKASYAFTSDLEGSKPINILNLPKGEARTVMTPSGPVALRNTSGGSSFGYTIRAIPGLGERNRIENFLEEKGSTIKQTRTGATYGVRRTV